MKLAGLRIFGFKTFAQATSLTFDAGVIAIVGPNGSGKSNLVDAIRWVLGEQSTKSLRSARTDDIIFAGNAKRKPLGMAEVTLTFDNSDGSIELPYKEIQITRRAYRAGDIEYYLNKERVRLRDVHELLMGTGLGPGSYAIVSQGQIDQILVSKPSERRALFEETAGVNKFLARKAEALRRLEGTNANVVRLSDLLKEVEARVPELDAQVRRALKYRNVGARVRDLEVLSVLRASAGRQAALTQARADADAAALALQQAAQAALAAETALTAAREEFTSAERQFEEARGAHEAARTLLAHAERESAALLARLETLVAQANSADGEHARHENERRRLHDGLQFLQAELEPLQRHVAESAAAEAAQAERLQEDRQIVDAAYAALREAEVRANTKLAEYTKFQAARESAEREHTQLETEERRIAEEWQQVHTQVGGANATLSDVERERAERNELLAAAQIDLEGAEARLQHAAAALPQAQADLRATTRELAGLEARLHTLEELEANLDGHVPGTRAVIEASTRGDLHGVIGVVSSLVDVDEAYARALDVAFGAGVSNIIAETANSAELAIEYLRQRELGRATLLPLELVAGRRGRELGNLSRIPGVIAYAHELVRTDERFIGAVAFLVGRTLVVDTMRTGVRLAREEQVRDTIVTLEGDQLIGGGAMSGGRSRRGERSILARRAEAQTLRDEHLPGQREALVDAEADWAKAAAEVDTATAVRDEARRHLQELRAVLRELDARESGLRSQAAQAQTRLDRLQHRRDEHDRRLAEIRERLAALPDIAAAPPDAAEERRTLEAGLQHARETIAHGEARLHETRALAAAARERLATITAQLEAAKSQQAALEADAGRQSGRRDAAAAEIAGLRERVAAAASEFDGLRAAEHEARQAVQTAQGARDELSARIVRGEREARTARSAERERLEGGESVRRRLAELEAELQLLQERWADSPVEENERAEIAERYNDAPDTILNELPKLRDDLARLSNVNLNAEADREELAARQTELTGQLEDFGRARELLLDGIRDLDETSQTQFLKTFETVRSAFADTYAELFPGGQAQMWLAEPDKPSESGIEISVQPPGKRMTSLAALSGGERAMTAVALIFALIRVKPSPFYLLDEIDAALDEMNVERFSRMVRGLAMESQLLIVTHNKKTMELAQKMYGITMAEPGMSSVVTASLDRELAHV